MRKLFITFFLLFYGVFAFSHSGKTDKNGCHTNKKTGEYHCHNSKPQAKTPAKQPTKKPEKTPTAKPNTPSTKQDTGDKNENN